MPIYDIKELTKSLRKFEDIGVHGRVHRVRTTGKVCFILLRDQIYSVQCVIFKSKTDAQINELFDRCTQLKPESYIILRGVIRALPDNQPKINSAYHDSFEFNITDMNVMTAPNQEVILPFVLDEVNNKYIINNPNYMLDTESKENKDDRKRNIVTLDTRLNNRVFDLRTPFNNSIFKIQSAICTYFRNHLLSKGFMEIHSPKLIGTPSEGGASVFELKYFNSKAYLAQSPQLYKQMCINADFNRVFEIGPVFRAENSVSHRHLCEFVGLDIEMALGPNILLDTTNYDGYHEIINTFWDMLVYVFNSIETKNKDEIAYIKSIHNYQDLKFTEWPIIIDFQQGVKMLREAGCEQDEFDDLSTANEKKLGELVKIKHNVDIFVLDKYPLAVRPFYTHPAKDGIYSHSYDVIMRGQEISSGSQREHNYDKLMERIAMKGMNPELLSHYLESFKYGSRPHGGAGFGLERIVMLYLDLDNVRECSLFPRDPSRVLP